jgi:hypothetical protein
MKKEINSYKFYTRLDMYVIYSCVKFCHFAGESFLKIKLNFILNKNFSLDSDLDMLNT